MHDSATVVTKSAELPTDCAVVIATSHRLGAMGERKRISDHLGPARNGDTPFDVLFVDEAWQLPHHLFDRVERAAPITVGVGDVGQLPPLEIGTNPWRGDPGFNPYRAWPTDYDGDELTYEARAAGGLAARRGAAAPVAGVLPRVGRAQLRRRTRRPHGRARNAQRARRGRLGAGGAPACRRCSRSTGWPTPRQPTSTCRS